MNTIYNYERFYGYSYLYVVRRSVKMVYIRVKKIKNNSYAYLVKNVWTEKKPKQITVKYLGNIFKLTIDDIPEEYRKTENVISFFGKFSEKGRDKESEKIYQDRLFEALINYDINEVLNIYSSATKSRDLADFYEFILIPVLQKIGDMWEKGILDVATEHACSNAASNLISILNNKFHTLDTEKKKPIKVILCTPEGEIHKIGCEILESLLLEKKYHVYNISPSAPNESIVEYVIETRPNLIIICLTLSEHKNTTIRLINELNKKYPTNIVIAGAGVIALKEDKTIENQNKQNKISILHNESISNFIRHINEYINV